MLNICVSYLFIICFVIQTLFSPFAQAVSPKTLYFEAESAYMELQKNPKKKMYRDNWLVCIQKFQDVYKQEPTGPWAAAGMYKASLIFLELYHVSGNRSDQREAIDGFERIMKRYTQSKYSKRAEHQLISIRKKSPKTPVTKPPADPPKQAIHSPTKRNTRLRVEKNSKKAKHATVNYLRYSTYTNEDFTRVVVEIDHEAEFMYRFLKKDPQLKKPMRVYVDIKDSRLSDRLRKVLPVKENNLKIPINDHLDVRISQNQPEVVRVVMYNFPHNGLEYTLKNYEIKKYFDPFRIVIDVKGKPYKSKNVTIDQGTSLKVVKKTLPKTSIVQQLGLGIQRIVIDPGHGGKDFGAPGYYKGTHEKDIVLVLAKKLAQKLREKYKYDVILTRTTDRFLTLEERTRFANDKNADLFISLHANASRNRKAFGIETYFLNLATDQEAIRVAAEENATSTKNISDLQTILTDLMQNAKINESSRLATQVQDAMITHLKQKKYKDIRDKGVKQAPFYVLLGARMPSILVETAFISNAMECRRLKDSAYQEELCIAIINGIQNYAHTINHSQTKGPVSIAVR